MADIQSNIRGDDYSSIEFISELSGYVVQFSGGGDVIRIELDDDHLQKIADLLAEWGWRANV